MTLSFYFKRLILLCAFLQVSAGSEFDSQITFPDFSVEENNYITAFGDTAYNPANHSYIINAGAEKHSSTGSCGQVLYEKKVRIQDVASGRVVASFSTSFSFTFKTHGLAWDYMNNPRDGSGMAFVFVTGSSRAAMETFFNRLNRHSSSCRTARIGSPLYRRPGFALYFDTDYNPNNENPSNNFIQISNNVEYYDTAAYTHNLCGNNVTHCSYFSTGRTFTAWIDFSSASQTLEVRLANGSSPGVMKPLLPLLHIPDYTLAKTLGDEVYLTFWGCSDVNHVESHELLSWSFFSSGIPESSTVSQMLSRFMKARKLWGGISLGVLGTGVALVILCFISWFARPSENHSYNKALGYATGPHEFSYTELRKATDDFDERNLLGSGASGSVYRGSFEGALVAVKQISFYELKQAESVFRAEVTSLGQIRHRNVVQLQGWCREKRRLLLVYDYMPNGDLNEWLHQNGSRRRHVLSLKLRQSILEGVGAALEYLHEDGLSCVLHRDIKSSNVLLDADFKPHLGDFGLARLIDHHKLDRTTLAAGTLGYMAPEIPYTGKATKESDVYSFGILVLEVVCGRRPLDLQTVEPEDLVLLYTVWRAHEGGSLLNMADPRLLHQTLQQSSRSDPALQDEATDGSIQTHDFLRTLDSQNLMVATVQVDVNVEVQKTMIVNLLHLGLLCCLPSPKARPSGQPWDKLIEYYNK